MVATLFLPCPCYMFSPKSSFASPGWGWWSWRFKDRIARFGGKSRPKRPEGLQGKQTSNASAELGEYCEGCQWASTRGYGWGPDEPWIFVQWYLDDEHMGFSKPVVQTGDHRTPITESNKPLSFLGRVQWFSVQGFFCPIKSFPGSPQCQWHPTGAYRSLNSGVTLTISHFDG